MAGRDAGRQMRRLQVETLVGRHAGRQIQSQRETTTGRYDGGERRWQAETLAG